MINTSDLLKILDKIPLWKRITSLPDKYTSLEKRVIELENKIKYTPGTCPSCASSNFGVESMRRGEQNQIYVNLHAKIVDTLKSEPYNLSYA